MPVMVIGLEIFIEAGSGSLAWARAGQQRLTDSRWKDPLVVQVIEDHMAGVCLCLQDHVGVVRCSVVVALEVDAVGEGGGGSP